MKPLLLFFLQFPGLAWTQETPPRSVSIAELINLALPLIIVSVFGWLFWLYRRNEQKQLRLMEANYRAALLGSDKIRAYELGFLYYCARRSDHTPTEEDQQKLLQELRQMDFTRSAYRH